MSHNSFGRLYRVMSWGESHGPAIGCVIDGTPPGLIVDEDLIEQQMARRRPGRSRYTTQRREADRVQILSGVYDDGSSKLRTTGTPIALMIENIDARSKDYAAIADRFRPSHADYTYFAKYGFRDPRGGGRSSARETAMRVAAGAIARMVLANCGVSVHGALIQVGGRGIDRSRWDWGAAEESALFCPDAVTTPLWEADIDAARRDGSSLGAVVEIVARGVPPGWGAPLYGKLDGDLAGAMMSINAVKGVAIGDGMDVAGLRGEENADLMTGVAGGVPIYASNHAGGILGGISSGQDIVVRFAVKPPASIAIAQRGLDRDGGAVTIATHGRHDPCVGIRAVPVGEAMMACVLADHYLRHRAQTGEDGPLGWIGEEASGDEE